jgi:hypothetical protein
VERPFVLRDQASYPRCSLLPIEAATPERSDRAFATSREKRVDAVFMGDGCFFQGQIHRIVEISESECQEIDVGGQDSTAPSGGCYALMIYGLNFNRKSEPVVNKGANHVIPTIGVMIGMYIVTRMVEMVLYAERKAGTKILAWVTVAVAVVGMLSLLTSGSNMPTLPR